ncbi:amidase family protein [Alkalicoccus halolimnae]|uniref:Amidase family protein n=1 Tax=Alkalicoccus halolimnae TaxID=1667239 RepID=A0AAJ8N2I1_9BACI|nr:amidase family protein [Alkalicoccus halolimnae]
MNKRSIGSALLIGALTIFTFVLWPAKKAVSNKRKNEAEKENFQLEGASIADIQLAFKKEQLSCVELTDRYLERIYAYDQQGPAINAVRMVNPYAREEAEKKDKERAAGITGALHGIPVILKDNIETGDGMPTTGGSPALAANTAEEDAFLTAKLKEAGAVILGKANMSEWAYFLTEGAPSGYSSIGGQVKHPYGPESFRAGSVGGSSSGSGAAIAADFAVIGIGTETSGSILSPASANSIVGIKPTVGLVSRSGIIPLAGSQDTAGPMARTVADAAIALGAMSGVDDKDPITKTNKNKDLTDYSSFLKKESLQGARIGVDYSFLSEKGKEERQLIERAIEDMEDQGAVIKEVEIPNESFESLVLWHELKQDLNAYLRKTPEQVPVSSIADVIAFNKEKPHERMRFGQTHFEKAEKLSGDAEDPEYVKHRQTDLRLSTTEGLDVVMQEEKLDALLFENNHGAAMPAKAGYPSITIPAGYTSEGMPVGVTLTAQAYSEPRLIELAYSYEQASNRRRAPQLV